MDTGFTQINDVVLAIPPEAIHIDRQSFNNIWQTLRTQSSIKNKSGFSQINITMSVKFADDVLFPIQGSEHLNGLHQLQNLIAQFRVTPFCYLDNEFIRNSILGGVSDKSMALVLRNLEISTTNSTTNVISVVMHFAWFNYFPYIKQFSFKKDIFTPDEELDPKNSRAWELFYNAEKIRNDYKRIDSIQSDTELTYSEFKFLPYKQYYNLKNEVDALNIVRNQASQFLNSQKRLPKTELISVFSAAVADDLVGASLADKVLGNDMWFTAHNIVDAIDTTLKDSNSFYSVLNDNNWKVVQLNGLNEKQELIKFKTKFMDNNDVNEGLTDNDLILLERVNTVNFDNSGLIVTNLSISFENILATIPMLGYSYPTYQHIGSIDSIVTLSIVANSENAVKALTQLYNATEEQAFKNRKIPQGHRNIKINNALINMCGLHNFLINGMTINTVPTLPGTYSGTLELINDQLTEKTSERLAGEHKFSTSTAIRAKIVEVLGNSLTTKRDLYNKDNDILKLNQNTALQNVVNNLTFQANYTDFYTYSGPDTQQKIYFKRLCEIYAQYLGTLLKDLVPVIQEKTLGMATFTGIYDLFSLTDEDIPGIERIQEDLYPIFQQNPILQQYQGHSITELKQLRSISKQTIQQRYIFLEEQLNKIRESLSESNESLNNNYAEKASILAKDIGKFGNATASFILQYLGDYHNKILAFLDKILYSGILNLVEFKDIKELINQNALLNQGDAYPDFPLGNVIDLLKASSDLESQAAYQNLLDIYDKAELGNQEVGLSVLLNPDFYFYNPQNDVLVDIVPSEVIETASQAIITSRDAMLKAEKRWFDETYDTQILGQTKISNQLKDISKIRSNKLFNSNKIGKEYISKIDRSLQANGTMPNQLTGSITSSIKQAAKSGETIKLSPIQGGEESIDSQNVIMNYRDATILTPKTDDAAVHFFDTKECVTVQPESAYRNENIQTGKLHLRMPVPDGCVPTSYFGKRYDPVKKLHGEYSEKEHYGLDLAPDPTQIPQENFLSLPITAAANGRIIYVEDPTNAETSGCHIYIDHFNGLMTYYQHLQNNDMYNDLYAAWKQQQEINDANYYSNAKLFVSAGETIGLMGTTGYSTGIHLHFGVYEYSGLEPNLSKSGKPRGTPIDPLIYLDPDEVISKGPIKGIEPQNESLLTKSLQQFEKELRNGQGYSMLRAYPTFKLYFIESDMGERKRYGFDDFFSYSAVKSIQVIKNKKIAADLCILELTNISGILSNRKFHSVLDPTQARDNQGNRLQERIDQPGARNTKFENPLASLLLQPGIQVQLRLGFNNNPNELETVFNGIITDVAFTDSDDLVQITCQSFAVELVQTIHGDSKTWGGSFSRSGKTYKILEEIMAFPEIVHFGRWEPNVPVGNTAYSLLSNRWKIVPSPQDDNIFAPQGDSILGLTDLIAETLMGSSKYTMYNTTLWDVIQEMTLRHPSYIASTVPYEDKWGPRMTLFFGVPDQMYYARDPSFKEDTMINALQNVLKYGNWKDADELLQSSLLDPNSEPPSNITQRLTKSDYKQRWFELFKKQFALDQGYIKPFRNYHVLTSALHIVYNSITASGHNTFNTATIQYGKKAATVGEDTGELNFGNAETFTMKADAAIPDEEVRELFAQYPNCVGEDMAKNYALSLLQQSMKESYKGSIVIIGNPKIKVHDVCLRENTPILTNKGYKQIQDIQIGDSVYSHKGILRKVTQTFKRKPNEKIITIKCKTDPEVLTGTTNHPVLSVKRKEIFDDKKPWLGKKEDFVPIYRPMGELEKNDYIACPRIKSKRNLNPALAKLIGYYLAEGNIVWDYRKTFNKTTKNNKFNMNPISNYKVPIGVQWSFNSETENFMIDEINNLLKEAGIAKKARGYFHKDKYGHQTKKGLTILLYDRDFTNFIIKEAGFSDYSGKREYLENKWLRNYFDEETTKNILGAYFNGDGSCDNKVRIGSLTARTTSINLGRCIRQMLLNIGIPATSQIQYYQNGCGFSKQPCYVYSNVVSKTYSEDLIQYTWYKPNNSLTKTTKHTTTVVDNLFVYVSIDDITDEETLPYVYNIGVEIDNSYIASGKIVHNCYIFDEYNDMYGPVEVEQVVHKFSQETGFLTEIVPNMCVHVNQFATLSTSDAMGLLVEHGMKSIGVESVLPAIQTSNKIIGYATGTSFLSTLFFSSKENTLRAGETQSLFGLVGTFLFKKLITRTQLAHPFRFSPLVLNNRPMIGGLPNRRTGGTFTELIGKWFSDFDKYSNIYMEDLMDKFNPRYWVGKQQGIIKF